MAAGHEREGSRGIELGEGGGEDSGEEGGVEEGEGGGGI